MLFHFGDAPENAGGDGAAGDLRAEVERLRDRERQMVELLGSASPERLVHDLRNLLNEVQLLRLLADDQT